MRFLTALTLFLFALVGSAFAQSEAEEKSSLITYVEEQLSTPNMQISLNGLEGSLSSNISLASITISDEDGVWLTIEKPQLVWNRSALLRGRVEIEQLTAERIDFPRPPKPDDSLPSAEAQPFSLPELPVSIRVDELKIGRMVIGEPVFGLAAEASLNGSVSFADATLDLDLTVDRLDAGGALAIQATFGGDPAELTLAISLQEPEDGIIANLLNLEGKPPVNLVVNGEGPVDDLTTTIALDVAEERIVDGTITLDRTGDVLKAAVKLDGPLGRILPANQRAFYGEQSRLEADALINDDGTIALDRVLLDSGSLQLVANAQLTADKFLSALNLDFRLAPTDGARIVLPGEGDQPSLGSMRATIDYDAAAADGWNAVIEAGSVRATDISIEQVRLLASGQVKNFNSAERRSADYTLAGRIRGVEAKDEGVQAALGSSLDLTSSGSWQAGQPLLLDQLRLVGEALQLTAKGAFQDNSFDGSAEVATARLAAFSGLAKRELSGAATFGVTGTVRPIDGTFDLNVSGAGQDLQVAIEQVDALLDGETTVSGGVARDEKGLEFDSLRVVNNQFNATVTGRYGSEKSNLRADVLLADAGLVTQNASGAVRLEARLDGEALPFNADLKIAMQDGRLAGREVRGLTIAFDGTTDLEGLKGALSGEGSISDQALSLAGNIDVQQARQSISDLTARLGETRLSGDMARNANGFLDGALVVSSDDISAAAALALVDASGAVNGTVILSSDGGQQGGSADLRVANLRYADTARIGSANIDVAFDTLFSNPKINAEIEAQDIRAGGIVVRRLDGDVQTQGERTTFELSADLDEQNASLQTQGVVVQSSAQTVITVSKLDVTSAITDARLARPVDITLANGTTRIGGARLQVGGGTVSVNGTAGERLDLSIGVDALPVSIANVFAPDLGAGGTVSGNAQIGGTASAPTARFDVRANAITVRALSDAGISPISVSGNGSFANNTVRIASVNASNSQGISLAVSGTVPLSGSGLNVQVDGTAPLGLGEAFLASRGTQLAGTVRLNATVTGSIADPQFGGLVSLSGATISDPLSNLRLNNVGLIAGLNGDRLTIQRASAQLSTGGSVSASGSVLLTQSMDANIDVVLSSARYTDGQTFSTTVDGRLSLTGPIASAPLLSGQIELQRTEIIVPETFGGSDLLLEVDHIAPSAPIERTLERVERASPTPTPNSRPVILNLDVTISAPSKIFVRGRGLDAELGGQLTVRGPVNDIRPQGRFELRRGRLSILGQRIVLDEGSITLTGSLDPLLNFLARVDAGDVTAFIRLRGRASDLDVSFESQPDLPEDEVLSQIIFGRSVGELSPFQIASLVSAAAQLTGGANTDIVSGLRGATGLDDLDVVSDADGNASVRAGKYIADNIYLGVEAGQNTKATINLDITDDLKARGAVGSDGGSEIGLFYERDY